MLMILALHFVKAGGVANSDAGVNREIGRAVYCLCFPCVDLFVLITGFFWNKNSHAVAKSCKIWLQTLFFSVGTMAAILLIFGTENIFSEKKLILALMPLSSNQYWFMFVYVGLLFLAPFLNLLIEKLSFRIHTVFCIVLILLFTVTPMILPQWYTLVMQAGYELLWFVVLYFIGAYLNRFDPFKKIGKYKCLALIAGVTVLEYVEMVVIEAVLKSNIIPQLDAVLSWNQSVRSYASFPVFISAVLWFEFFRKLEIKNEHVSKAVCRVSSLCIGVYLIHLGVFVWDILFTRIFHPDRYYDSAFLWIYFIFFVASIFTAGCAVEYIRQLLFNKLNSKIGMWVEEKAIAVKDRIITACSKHINLPDAAE
jgi:hypothetical protein